MFTIDSNNSNLLNFLIAIFPFSLIIGNLATNINIALVCLLGFFIYRKNILFIKNKIHQLLIYIFFFYLIIITFINNWGHIEVNELQKTNLYKSLFYLRYLALFLVITKLIDENKFNTRLFFISCAFFSIIISFDVLFQLIFGKNILGYPLTELGRPSSFFKGELIAGGYIQKFSLFAIFLLAAFKKNESSSSFLLLFLFAFFLFTITVTLNRMPMLIYIFSFILYFLIEKKFKEIIIILLFTSGLLLLAVKIFPTYKLQSDFKKIYFESKDIIVNAKDLFLYNKLKEETHYPAGYIIHFNSGIQIWKKNKIFGNGLKSFRLKCIYKKYQTCNTHPHNYFIELLVDVGIIGLFLIYTLFITGVFNFFKYYNNEKNINNKFTSIVFFLLMFFEFFPFRTSGSFFTTNVSTFFFMILPIFLNLKNLKKL